MGIGASSVLAYDEARAVRVGGALLLEVALSRGTSVRGLADEGEERLTAISLFAAWMMGMSCGASADEQRKRILESSLLERKRQQRPVLQ